MFLTALLGMMMIMVLCYLICTVKLKDPKHVKLRQSLLNLVHFAGVIYTVIIPFVTNNPTLLTVHLAIVLLTLLHWQFYNNKCILTKIININNDETDKSSGHIQDTLGNLGIKVPSTIYKSLEYIILIGVLFVSSYKLGLSAQTLIEYVVITVVFIVLSMSIVKCVFGINGTEKGIKF